MAKYFGGLYTTEKDGVSGVRVKAAARLGAIIFAAPRDRAWKEAHADAIEEIIDWYDSGDEADRPKIMGQPCTAMLMSSLDGLIVPGVDIETGRKLYDHYMSGREGRPSDWASNPASSVNIDG